MGLENKSQLEKYITTRDNCVRLEREIERLVDEIGTRFSGLNQGKWKKVLFAGTQMQGKMPVSVLIEPFTFIDTSNDELIGTIGLRAAEWHDNLHNCRSAYSSLSALEREDVLPPPR